MYHQTVFLWMATVFIQDVTLQNAQVKAPTEGGFDLIISKIESRLSIASKLVDTARRELRNDVNQICGNNSCSGRSMDCNKWKRNCPDAKPRDCSDIYNHGYNTSGIYEIWPRSRSSNGPMIVYCDMEDGGGWTVVQRRGDFGNPNDYFYQDWNVYKKGFGHLLREFWIGNENLFVLTSQRSYKLKVDLRDWEEDAIKYATYEEFWVDDEVHQYALHIGTYEGTAGDSLKRHNGSMFSTKDRDNDAYAEMNCATLFTGAWWFIDCLDSNLNGYYHRGDNVPDHEGIKWRHLKGFSYSLKDSIMKIKASDL